jgi:hypothetical protein
MMNKFLLSSLLFGSQMVGTMSFTLTQSSLQTTAGVTSTRTAPLQMNFFTDIGDMFTGGAIGEETNLPYSPPLCDLHSVSGDVDDDGEKKIRSYAIKERGLSFTGR